MGRSWTAAEELVRGSIRIGADVTKPHLALRMLTVQRHVAHALAAGKPLLDVCAELARVVCQELEWDFWELWGNDADGRPRLINLPDAPQRGLEPFVDATRAMVFQPGEGLPGRVWNSGRPEWVASFDDDARFLRSRVARACGLQTGFGVPLVAGGEVFLMMSFFSRARRQEDTATLEFLMAIGAQLAEVSRRQRAEEKARVADDEAHAERDRLHSMLESAPGFILETDREGCVLYVNRTRTVPREQMLGLPWTWTTPPEQRQRLHALFQEAIASGEPRDFQLELLDAEAKPRQYQGRIGPLRRAEKDGRQAIVGAVIVVQDVTESRRMQVELEAAQRLAGVGTMAAGVAHEINNALAPILSNLQAATGDVAELLERGAHAPDLLPMLEDARASAERIRGIARDLKLLARPKSEPTEPVEVVPAIESALRLAHNEIRHRAQVIRDYREVPPVEATEGRLGQVLLNLLINAAQAIPEGRADRNQIRVATRLAHDGAVYVEVTDSGSGIPNDVLRNLFTPFFTTKEDAGTGLGLTICDKIVRGFGGHIEVQSEVGRGTTFRVFLPVARATERRPTPAPLVAPTREPSRGRVLVIDDEPAIGQAVTRVLSRAHEVVFASSARDALARLARGERFDVILCDVMMPEVTGPDFVEQLGHELPDQADKVVFITGGAFAGRSRDYLEQSSHLVVDKPFSPRQLLDLVGQRMRARA